MMDRVEVDKADSDVAAFYALLFYGEMLTKVLVASLVEAVDDDRDRNRYRLHYRLVRADGIGEWASVLDEILTGTASQYLVPAARKEQKQLTQKLPSGNWQYSAVELLRSCAKGTGIQCDPVSGKVAARQWFPLFAAFRNKTRGHGATSGRQCAEVCEGLEKSINLFAENFALFQRPWAYLHRNLSGKFRVTHLGGDHAPFEYLKRTTSENLADGVYLALDSKLVRVELT